MDRGRGFRSCTSGRDRCSVTAAVDGSELRSSSSLSLGKRRALQAMSTPEHVFAILAIDHISALSSVARPDDPASMTPEELVSIKVQLVESMAQDSSGVLIDPILGLGPLILDDVVPGDIGLLVGLEDGDYASLTDAPRLFEGWDVGRAARSGATAVKCSFLYDPFSPSEVAYQFVSDLVASCELHGLPLFAEPLAPHPSSTDRRSVVVESARTIGALGVDVLKLEFPGDSSNEPDWREACLEVTAASTRPWTLLSAGADFEAYARQLAVACEAGASGFVAGRAVWKDLVVGGFANNQAQLREAKRRLRHLVEIATAHGAPWSAWFETSS